MPDYSVNSEGFPTSAHKWDEQFFVKGERLRIPSEAKLLERIEQLNKALFENLYNKAQGGWIRELAWRKSQLEQVRRQDVSDTEPEV